MFKLAITLLLLGTVSYGKTFSTGFRHIKGISGRLFTYEQTGKLDLEVPNDFSWKDTGKLAAIGSQGRCGSCWSWALTYSLIDNLTLLGSAAADILSPQYLVSCAKNMYGCNGGTFEAAEYLTDLSAGGKGIGGAPTLSDMPYTASNGRCKTGLKQAGNILEWHYIGSSRSRPSTVDVQKAMLSYGVIPIVIAADGRLMNYHSGVFEGNSRSINHMIVAVGFHNEGAKPDQNGEYPRGKGYWEVRNSWGADWGVGGFGDVRYHANSIAQEAAFFKVLEKPIPPVPREFAMESKNLTLKVTLSEVNTLKIDDAKKILQPFLNSLNAR